MSKDKQPNKPISEQELLDYLEGNIKGVDANQIERQILSSSFEEEAFQGLSEHPVDDIKEDFMTLRERLSQKQIYQKPGILNIAATVAFLIVAFGSIWFVVNNALPSNEISMKSVEDSSNEQAISVADTLETQSVVETPNEPLVADNEPLEERVQEVDELPIEDEVEEPETSDLPEQESDDLADGAGGEQFALNDREESSEPEEIPLEETVEEESIANNQISSDVSADVDPSALAKKSLAAPAQARSAISQAEVQSVKGTVYYREDGEPLVGVQVSVDGNRTVSGLNGQFELTGVGLGSTLNFSGQGIISKEINFDSTDPVNVVLAPSSTSQKAVVIGYDNIVNKSPEPSIGRNAFQEYVNTSLQYPEAARSQQIEGVVVLKLTVSSDGSINNIEVKKSVSASCDQEAVRLIEEGPQWTSGTYNGDPVESSVRIRILFSL